MDITSDAQLRTAVQYLKDRQEILDVIVRESRGRDRHDIELISNCYWPEGADEHGPVPISATRISSKGESWSRSCFFDESAQPLEP